MFNIVMELNELANRLTDDLIAAKRAAKGSKGKTAAYQQGRAEELEKWLQSTEAMLAKITDEREKRRYTEK